MMNTMTKGLSLKLDNKRSIASEGDITVTDVVDLHQQRVKDLQKEIEELRELLADNSDNPTVL